MGDERGRTFVFLVLEKEPQEGYHIFSLQCSVLSLHLLDSLNSAPWHNSVFTLLFLNKWNLKAMKTSLGLGRFG